MYEYTIPLMGIFYSSYRITDTISIRGKSEKIVSTVKFYQRVSGKIGSINKLKQLSLRQYGIVSSETKKLSRLTSKRILKVNFYGKMKFANTIYFIHSFYLCYL